MQMAVTNATAGTLAAPDTLTTVPTGGTVSPVFVVATGGNVQNPFPYPFNHVRSLATTATKTLPMNLRDLRRRTWDTLDPGQEWNQLIQAGKVTVVLTDVATDNDFEGYAAHQN